jgi:hypothetical protein
MVLFVRDAGRTKMKFKKSGVFSNHKVAHFSPRLPRISTTSPIFTPENTVEIDDPCKNACSTAQKFFLQKP